MSEKTSLDILIVGAGFSGCYMLNSLRSKGFSVKVFESAPDLGGVWYWNNYPGARTDSEYLAYQFTDPFLLQNFDYTERFPSRNDLLRYFNYMEEKFQLKKDIVFNNKVTAVKFDEDSKLWKVESTNSTATYCRHLLLCIGFAAKSYLPDFKGLEEFEGEIYHSAHWPRDRNVNFENKRVAVIGTGASAVQIIQEIGPIVKQLTVFQRTPNLALPMQQCSLPNSKLPNKQEILQLLSMSRETFGGIPCKNRSKNTFEDSEDERESLYEEIWAKGGFSFFLENYQDVLMDEQANLSAYTFWAKKVRNRIIDERKKNILAPLDPPHPFGAKRPSLEQSYYETFNLESVDIIDINQSPIIQITATGIETRREGIVEFDVVIFATGFDSITGSFLKIDIENGKGQKLQNEWENGIATNLGMSLPAFPNLFYMYGPQAPTAFSNGPSCIEIQGEWLTRMFVYLRAEDITRIEAKEEAAKDWTRKVKDVWNMTLLPKAKSWYQGCNIPGKVVEPLNFVGGLPVYINDLEICERNDYKGFIVQKNNV